MSRLPRTAFVFSFSSILFIICHSYLCLWTILNHHINHRQQLTNVHTSKCKLLRSPTGAPLLRSAPSPFPKPPRPTSSNSKSSLPQSTRSSGPAPLANITPLDLSLTLPASTAPALILSPENRTTFPSSAAGLPPRAHSPNMSL